MDKNVFKELNQQQITPMHQALLDLSVGYLRESRSRMAGYYGQWDKNLKHYQSTKPERKKDERQEEENAPTAQTIPFTWAQVQTWVAFASSILGQRARPFEFEPGGNEDAKWQTLGEELLHVDLKVNKWEIKRGQFLKQLGIFGLGVFKHSWCEKKLGLTASVTEGGTVAFDQTFGGNKKIEVSEHVVRKGNDIQALSPYRFFPDPNVDLSCINEGRFVGSEHEYHEQQMKAWNKTEEVAGIKYVPKTFREDDWKFRKDTSRFSSYRHAEDAQSQFMVVDELQMRIIPSQYKLADGTPLGDSNHPINILVWVANDARIVKLELMNYMHGEFTYDTAVFDTEMHRTVNKTITDIMENLQITADWFLNSRVESVTRNVEVQLIADPSAVEVSDITDGNRLIRLKKGATRGGIDSYIKQLQTTDPTSNNMRDVQDLARFMEFSTGMNANMLGQFHTGRRSATEAKVVAGGAAARAGLIVQEIFVAALGPGARKWLINLRQGLNPDDIFRMAGQQPEDVVKAFKSAPDLLIRNYDSWVFDSTTSGEKSFMASMLMDLANSVMSNPQAAVSLNLSPRLLLEKVFELQGIKGKDDLALENDQSTLSQIIQQQAQALAQQMLEQHLKTNPQPSPTNE